MVLENKKTLKAACVASIGFPSSFNPPGTVKIAEKETVATKATPTAPLLLSSPSRRYKVAYHQVFLETAKVDP